MWLHKRRLPPFPLRSAPALPAPADLSGKTSSAVRLQADGSDLFDLVPPRNFSADGELGVFTPDFDPAAPAGGTVGLGVYQLNDPSLSEAHFVRYTGASQVFEQSLIWIGLANFDTNRWDWRNAASLSHPNYVDLADIGPYIASDGSLIVAFVIMGDLPFKLHRVGVSAFDEFEDNDSLVSASLIPHRVMRGLHGSLGSGPGYPGMDGDNIDIWRVDAPGSQGALRVELTYDLATVSDLVIEILEPDGTPDTTVWSYGSAEGQVFYFRQEEVGGVVPTPAYIRVTCGSGYSDYMLDVTLGNPPPFLGWMGVSPPSAVAPALITLSASATDTDGFIYDYHWRPMDNLIPSPVIRTREPVYVHLYEEPGEYWTMVNARDNDGFFNEFPGGESGVLILPPEE